MHLAKPLSRLMMSMPFSAAVIRAQTWVVHKHRVEMPLNANRKPLQTTKHSTDEEFNITA